MAAKSVTCVIKYDNNTDGIYFSGDLLSGTVTLTLTKSTTVRGISLTVLGQAKSKWNTGSAGKINITHSGKENYLKSISYLLGEKNGADIDIQPGIYIYKFSCVLPPLLPTSFEHDDGSIKYTVTVNLDRPFKIDDSFTVLFTVLKRVDLNYESPDLRLPVVKSENKSLYSCCIPSGKITINASTPQQGYVPGECIDIDVNLSGATEKVYELKIKLKKVLTFISDNGRKKIIEDSVNELQETRISSHSTKTLVVPRVPPTLVELSKIIHITYQVVVTVCVSGPHYNPDVIIPITIGTIKLVDLSNETSIELPSPSAPLINYNYNQSIDTPQGDAVNSKEKN